MSDFYRALILLACALVVALLAWGFWHFAGASAFQILPLLAMAALFAENLRLRRELRKRSA